MSGIHRLLGLRDAKLGKSNGMELPAETASWVPRLLLLGSAKFASQWAGRMLFRISGTGVRACIGSPVARVA